MITIRITQIQFEDNKDEYISQIVELEKLIFDDPWDASAISQMCESETQRVYALIQEDGRVAAYCCCQVVLDEGEILRIAVEPTMRRMGIGRSVLIKTIDAMRQESCNSVFLEVREDNLPAINLYKSFGFEDLYKRKDYYGKGKHARIFKILLVGLITLCSFLFMMTSCSKNNYENTASASSSVQIHFRTPEPTFTESPTEKQTPVPTPKPTPTVPSSDDAFVNIKDFIPNAIIELKYATTDNFTGKVIYNFSDAYARYGTVKKLMRAADMLSEKGYSIKIWDAFRPVSAQFRLWEVCPDPTYVANPNVGYSNHTRGCAIDLTIVDGNGQEVLMPTCFDDFSGRADRDYSDVDKKAADNSRFLESVMESCGFSGYYGEWWHYNDTVKYQPESVFEP